MSLAILCITKNETHAKEFLEYNQHCAKLLNAKFVIAYDRCEKPIICADQFIKVGCSTDIVENVLSYCYRKCSTKYVLRLDDDEILDDTAIDWIKNTKIRLHNVVGFHRYNLYQNYNTIIKDLYPDTQVRLMLKTKENRKFVHEGREFNTLADGHILHYKFLIKDIEHRIKIAQNYEKNKTECGFGKEFSKFNLPELYYNNNIELQTIQLHTVFKPRILEAQTRAPQPELIPHKQPNIHHFD